MKKKNAVMLADTRPALVGTVLLQLQKTNPGLFSEAVIYYAQPISESDQNAMQKIMPCRFLEYHPPLPEALFEKPRFARFSVLMFCRYEMFSWLDEFDTITWLDTDILIQGDLSAMVSAAWETGAVFIREDPQNNTAGSTDRMRTCFTKDLQAYNMNEYLYCSGTIVLSKKIGISTECTDWCYRHTVKWADILELPDQGVLNAAIQAFSIPVSIVPGKTYCCYPSDRMQKNCMDAKIIHAWGTNKFWNDWYVYTNYPGWKEYYQAWIDQGGSALAFEIKPLISVIIPSYKPNLDWMKECLDSLAGQNKDSWERFSDFEIIIIAEPYEQEGLRRLVDSYQDTRMQVLFNDTRSGIAASLNRGMRLAQGKYIARVDDDDICAPQRLYLQSQYLQQHPDVTLCTSDFEYFGDMNEYRVSMEGEMCRAWSVFTCPFDHPTVMFRRDFFMEHALFYDEQRGYVEDWELWRRAFADGMTVGCIHKALFYHRWMNAGSAGQTNKTIDMMRELVQKNFLELGVEIAADDLALIGPWNGKLMDEALVQKLEGYLQEALNRNQEKGIYDQACLKEVFQLRLAEAKTGVLPGLSKKIERKDREAGLQNTVQEAGTAYVPYKANLLKRILKRMLRPFYAPIQYRYESRIVQILEREQANEERLNQLQQSIWVNEGHLYDCIKKMDQIMEAQRGLMRWGERIEEAQERQFGLLCEVQRGELEHDKRTYDDLQIVRQREQQLGDNLYDMGCELRYIKEIQSFGRMIRKKIVLIGTPEHSNIGDAAITLGEIEFIRRYFPEYDFIELSKYDYEQWYGRISGLIGADDIIFLQGGGNLGNRYIEEERLRRQVIQDFPNQKIVIFPQTIFFADGQEGKDELAASADIYNRHRDLTLFVRGKNSLDFAERYFPNVKSHLMLDAALMLKSDFDFHREGVLLCLRAPEDEGRITYEQQVQIEEMVLAKGFTYTRSSNWYGGMPDKNIYKDMRRQAVFDELQKYAKQKIVITDRLHGFIFSVLTGTPCIVLSSCDYKLDEFFAFFEDSNAVFFAGKDVNAVERLLDQACAVPKPYYPVLALKKFDEMNQVIQTVSGEMV